MGKINKEWHLANKMPKNPSSKQRLDWHLHHNENCQCRVLTADERNKLENLVAQNKK